MSPEVVHLLDRAAPLLILWSFAFTLIHAVRIVRRFRRGPRKVPDNALLTELAGLPLTLLQSVAFVVAALHGDWPAMLLFLWWGPGFVVVLLIVAVARLRRRRIDWHPVRYPISYLCKLYYLAYVAVFFAHGLPGMVFAFKIAGAKADQAARCMRSRACICPSRRATRSACSSGRARSMSA